MNSRREQRPWLALMALVLIGVAAVGLAWFLFGPLLAVDKDVLAAIVTGTATLIGVVVTLIVTHQNDRRREAEQKIREAKTPVYEQFMSMTLHLALSPAPGRPVPTAQELGEFFQKWFPTALIWASSDVLLAIADWRRQLPATSSTETNLANYIQLFRIMRADLGHDDRNLSDEDLILLLSGKTWDYIPGTFQP